MWLVCQVQLYGGIWEINSHYGRPFSLCDIYTGWGRATLFWILSNMTIILAPIHRIRRGRQRVSVTFRNAYAHELLDRWGTYDLAHARELACLKIKHTVNCYVYFPMRNHIFLDAHNTRGSKCSLEGHEWSVISYIEGHKEWFLVPTYLYSWERLSVGHL